MFERPTALVADDERLLREQLQARLASTRSALHWPLAASKRAARICTSAAPSRVPANQTAIRSPPGRSVMEAE